MLRAELTGQHQVAESVHRRERQHEKDHDGAVQREQREIELRSHHAALRRMRPQDAKQTDCLRRIHQVKPHDERQQNTQDHGPQRKPEIQLRDRLVMRYGQVH